MLLLASLNIIAGAFIRRQLRWLGVVFYISAIVGFLIPSLAAYVVTVAALTSALLVSQIRWEHWDQLD